MDLPGTSLVSVLSVWIYLVQVGFLSCLCVSAQYRSGYCLVCVDLHSTGLVSVLSVWICTGLVSVLSVYRVVCKLTAVCLSATEHRVVCRLTAGVFVSY